MGVIDKALDIANKFIPDKDTQAELEKELRKLDVEDAKTKQKLFERIIPLTFPICVWIGCAWCLWGLILSILAFFLEKRYIFFEVNVPNFLIMCYGVKRIYQNTLKGKITRRMKNEKNNFSIINSVIIYKL